MTRLEKLLKQEKEVKAKIQSLEEKEEVDEYDEECYNDLQERLSYIKYDIAKIECDYVSDSGVCYYL